MKFPVLEITHQNQDDISRPEFIHVHKRERGRDNSRGWGHGKRNELNRTLRCAEKPAERAGQGTD